MSLTDVLLCLNIIWYVFLITRYVRFLSNRVMYYHDTMCRCLSTGQWVYMHWHVRGRRITVLKSVTDDSLMVSWYHFFKRTPFQITLFSQLTNLIRKKQQFSLNPFLFNLFTHIFYQMSFSLYHYDNKIIFVFK